MTKKDDIILTTKSLDSKEHVDEEAYGPDGSYVPRDGDIVTKSGNVITESGIVLKHTPTSGSSDVEKLGDDVSDHKGLRVFYGKSHIFQDPEVADYYRGVYEKATYEGRFHFDPEFTWEPAEEKALVRRLEWKACFWACIMFMALQLDRGNIAQALSDNMLNDLGLTTNDYNTGQTIFYVSFLAAELPSQLVSKKLGPDRWIPAQITLWSIVAICQSQLSGKGSFYATRAIIGLLEGGFIADTISWLSYFYTGTELPVRLSFFWTSLTLTQIFSSLAAFGILRMRGVAGWGGWRWLFLLEGLLTLLIGIASFFKMPASPVQTRAPWRPKGWFTEREEKIIVNRVLRDDPSKGDMHNRQAVSIKQLWYSLIDYDLWPLYLIGLVAYIPTSTVSAYMTLTLRQLGFSTFDTNLLTIPANVVHIVFLLVQTYLTEYFNERSLSATLQPLWILPCIGTLAFWSGSLTDVWGTYALLTVLLSGPYIHAILVGWCSRNSNTVRTRTVSAAVYNMFVQAGGITASNIYRKDDAPKYRRGNRVLFGITFVSLSLLLFTKAYYIWKNRSREKVWSAMTPQEQHHYRATTTDKGNKRLDFRFAH
ncbi:uncharacterized protein SAPINGB_P001308 [Magnusiomyces paraingens]|uniref:Major facilitator superfamily (MFS) profile domain-containing protein n=1 Tax=Magnusiomyces paraingens TaxID=2606893 RepID=A0A5E8B784_9ASCO|nr:uncharacterized protein SAPINGB_P001308 [Saprochaete ingens]VVT46628.1 unnamed protein product [Saprochaete ingens]